MSALIELCSWVVTLTVVALCIVAACEWRDDVIERTAGGKALVQAQRVLK